MSLEHFNSERFILSLVLYTRFVRVWKLVSRLPECPLLSAGDTRSGQPDKEALEEDDQLRDSDPNNDNFIFASQQSNGQGTKRKASFVAEPIHQKRRQIETRQRAKMSAMFKK